MTTAARQAAIVVVAFALLVAGCVANPRDEQVFDIGFQPSTADLSHEGVRVSEALVSALVRNPAATAVLRGYGDMHLPNGRFPEYNLALAARRADAVADLLAERSIERARVSFLIASEGQPWATEEDQSKVVAMVAEPDASN